MLFTFMCKNDWLEIILRTDNIIGNNISTVKVKKCLKMKVVLNGKVRDLHKIIFYYCKHVQKLDGNNIYFIILLTQFYFFIDKLILTTKFVKGFIKNERFLFFNSLSSGSSSISNDGCSAKCTPSWHWRGTDMWV